MQPTPGEEKMWAEVGQKRSTVIAVSDRSVADTSLSGPTVRSVARHAPWRGEEGTEAEKTRAQTKLTHGSITSS